MNKFTRKPSRINDRHNSLVSYPLKSYVSSSSCLLLYLLLCTLSNTITAVTPPGYINNIGVPSSRIDSGEMQDLELRVLIEPGRIECFYQEAKKDHNFDVSFQVISSSGSYLGASTSLEELKVDFSLTDPLGTLVASDIQSREGSHSHSTTVAGVYKLCFANTGPYSRTAKMVNLDIYLSSDTDDDRWGQYASVDNDGNIINNGYSLSPETGDSSFDKIRTSFNKIRDDLIRVGHEQEERRAIERRDRNIVEANFEYINRFSLLTTVVTLIVLLVQLVFIKSFFDDSSILRKHLRSFYK